jgi:hypothetical protein
MILSANRASEPSILVGRDATFLSAIRNVALTTNGAFSNPHPAKSRMAIQRARKGRRKPVTSARVALTNESRQTASIRRVLR